MEAKLYLEDVNDINFEIPVEKIEEEEEAAARRGILARDVPIAAAASLLSRSIKSVKFSGNPRGVSAKRVLDRIIIVI